MPILLYNTLTPPDFLQIRGQWDSPYDNKCCGWTSEQPPSGDYEIITKQQFIDRVILIHSNMPYLKGTGEDPTEQREPYTEEEIVLIAEEWFDQTNL